MHLSKYIIRKAKQRLTKIRRRKLGLKTRHAPTKERKREVKREEKPCVVAKVSKIVEAQLLKELLDGTYLERYYKDVIWPVGEDDDDGPEFVEGYIGLEEDEEDMEDFGSVACDEFLNNGDVKNMEVEYEGSGERHGGI